jgi:3-ketoacyl-CoA synthase
MPPELIVFLSMLQKSVHSMVESGQLQKMWQQFAAQSLTFQAGSLAIAAAVVVSLALLVWWWRRETIFLVDFECYRPPEHLKVTYDRFDIGSREANVFNEEAMDFQNRILAKSALSEDTFFPAGLHKHPPIANMALAREEAELVMFNAVEKLLERTGLHPRQIDVLVVNCSLFNPTPSLSAMIINKFKMKTDIESYNLGGMGCSAGIISIGLARKLLQSLGRRGYALVVSTENITQNWYQGNERSMLIPNTIFRMGSAAALLSNKRSEGRRALYKLQNLVRVHLGANDEAFRCVYQHADDNGIIGVELNRDLVKVAAKSMEVNLTRLGPLVLPWGEKLSFAANWVARKALKMRVAAYVPDFTKAFDHFCLHVGGRGVVEGLSKQLGLSARQMAPSANTLYWYGNTSSSTVWYSFGYVESAQGVKKGELVWQIGFGSGFKCNSAVWKALKPIKRRHNAWAHLEGRETEAMDKLKEIAAINAAEKHANGTVANGTAMNGHAPAPAVAADAAPDAASAKKTRSLRLRARA